MVRSISAQEAWDAAQRGHARILDLRTRVERTRYGWPPGAPKVSLLRHVLLPESGDVIYLCQHANRSKLTSWRGAPEIAGGWKAWVKAGLPIEGASRRGEPGPGSRRNRT